MADKDVVEKTVDIETHDMIYGRTIFEDGTVIPYCKPTPNSKLGMRVDFVSGEWKWIPKNLYVRSFDDLSPTTDPHRKGLVWEWNGMKIAVKDSA